MWYNTGRNAGGPLEEKTAGALAGGSSGKEGTGLPGLALEELAAREGSREKQVCAGCEARPAGEEEIAMGLFRKKKKAPLFGGSVEPSCAYCRHNSGSEGQVLCSLRKERKDGSCKNYQYDPLMREPRVAPPLRTSQFTEEDFKL